MSHTWANFQQAVLVEVRIFVHLYLLLFSEAEGIGPLFWLNFTL